MKLLALDTTTEWCSVALLAGQVWTEAAERAGQGHSDRLLPMIRQLLDERQLALSELDAIAFGAGPGSFTGLRIACGVAQGLALGAGCPLVPVNSLLALAAAARLQNGAESVVAALDARMNEVYWAAYSWTDGGWSEVIAPLVAAAGAVPLPDGAGWWVAGNGPTAYPMLTERMTGRVAGWLPDAVPTARAVGECAMVALAAGETGLDPAQASPLYIRQRVALTTAEREAGVRL